MIPKAYLLVPLALTAGFVGGFGSRHFREDTPPVTASLPSTEAPSARGESASPAGLNLKSTDTVDSLLALEDGALYQRLALWLMDADEAGISSFFDRYQKTEEQDEGVLKLLFARWTKIDPSGALKAAKGSDHEAAAWWAWAMNDPEAAVRDVPKEFFDDVVRALSRFHPDQVEPVVAAHPEFSIWSDSEEIARNLAVSDPGAALHLLRAHGDEFETEVIKDWTRRDPHAVLAWLEDHPDRTGGAFEEGFLKTLEKDHPGLLAELAARARSGSLKWVLEGAAFRHLAKQDPAAALAMAEATESPRVKAERLTELGRATIGADPQGAVVRFEEVFRTLPDAASRVPYVRYAGLSESSGGETIAGLDELVEQLVATDARAAMEAAVRHGAEAADMVADEWVSKDMDGFSTWLLEQPAGPVRDEGAKSVANQFSYSKEFPEALVWASEIGGQDDRTTARMQILIRWLSQDPAAAGAWIDSAELPDHERAVFKQFVPR